MRILHVGKYYPPHMGGTEIYTQQLVRRQSVFSKVGLVVSNYGSKTVSETVDGAKLTRLARIGVIASMPVNPSLPYAIRRFDSDIVHMHMPNPAAALAYLLSGHRGKLILTHHADTVGRKKLRRISDPIVRRVMRRASLIIVTSQRYLETSEELADFRDRCAVVPLGIDPGPYLKVCETDVAAIHQQFGNRILLCIGRLVEFKGFQYAIEAFARLGSTMSDVRLLIAGEGMFSERLSQLAAELGVSDRVHFLGVIDNERIPTLLKASMMVLFPSIRRTESFGYVQLEAMAAGVPVINTSIDSGAAEVSLDGVTGLTVPPKDSASLASAIKYLMENYGLRTQYGAAGIERVQRLYTLDKMVEQTMDLYRSALHPAAIGASIRVQELKASGVETA